MLQILNSLTIVWSLSLSYSIIKSIEEYPDLGFSTMLKTVVFKLF